jgi:hypothetical protein
MFVYKEERLLRFVERSLDGKGIGVVAYHRTITDEVSSIKELVKMHLLP